MILLACHKASYALLIILTEIDTLLFLFSYMNSFWLYFLIQMPPLMSQTSCLPMWRKTRLLWSCGLKLLWKYRPQWLRKPFSYLECQFGTMKMVAMVFSLCTLSCSKKSKTFSHISGGGLCVWICDLFSVHKPDGYLFKVQYFTNSCQEIQICYHYDP